MIQELDKLNAQSGNISIAMLPAQHEIRNLLRQISSFIIQAFSRDEMVMLFSQKIVQQLYKIDSVLSRECYVLLLERLFELSKRVAKEVTSWILYAEDEVCHFCWCHFLHISKLSPP